MSDIQVLSKNDITGFLYEITYLISYVQNIYSAFKMKKKKKKNAQSCL